MAKKRKNPLQLAFYIMPIDEKATRRVVEDYLEEVRQYRQIGFVRRNAAVTPSYEPRYHGDTNDINKAIENIAIWNVDREMELKRKSELLDLAMSKLSTLQREVIMRSYLDDEGEFDYINAGEIGISDSTYRREKRTGIFTLACLLNLEVFQAVREKSI